LSVIYRLLAIPGSGGHTPIVLGGQNAVVDSSAQEETHFR
jgi:hypothetical protein